MFAASAYPYLSISIKTTDTRFDLKNSQSAICRRASKVSPKCQKLAQKTALFVTLRSPLGTPSARQSQRRFWQGLGGITLGLRIRVIESAIYTSSVSTGRAAIRLSSVSRDFDHRHRRQWRSAIVSRLLYLSTAKRSCNLALLGT
jgi:hypothetical protein